MSYKVRVVALGLRQNRMARDLGIDTTRLNRILNGWIEPSVQEQDAIEAYLRERNDGEDEHRDDTIT